MSTPTLPVFKVAWNEMTWEGKIIVKEKRKSKGGQSKQVRKIYCCHVKNEQLKLVKKQSQNRRKKVPWRKMWLLQLFSVFNWESIINFFFYLFMGPFYRNTPHNFLRRYSSSVSNKWKVAKHCDVFNHLCWFYRS